MCARKLISRNCAIGALLRLCHPAEIEICDSVVEEKNGPVNGAELDGRVRCRCHLVPALLARVNDGPPGIGREKPRINGYCSCVSGAGFFGLAGSLQAPLPGWPTPTRRRGTPRWLSANWLPRFSTSVPAVPQLPFQSCSRAAAGTAGSRRIVESFRLPSG
jgi:hypothetical protein